MDISKVNAKILTNNGKFVDSRYLGIPKDFNIPIIFIDSDITVEEYKELIKEIVGSKSRINDIIDGANYEFVDVDIIPKKKEPMSLKDIFEKVCCDLQVGSDDIKSKDQSDHLVVARKVFSAIAHRKDYTYKQIGEIINRDTSTISHYITTNNNYLPDYYLDYIESICS